MSVTGAAPDYVRRGVIVPGGRFCEDARGFGGGGEVCGDEVEALRFMDCTGLVSTLAPNGVCVGWVGEYQCMF